MSTGRREPNTEGDQKDPFSGPTLIGFVIALPNEWKYFRRAFGLVERGRCNDLTQYRCRFGALDCVVLIGGAGRENAARAARTLVEHHSVQALISLGYAGALSGRLVRGDIVLSAYSMIQKNPALNDRERELDQILRGIADRSHEHHVCVGPLFTAERIVARHEEKRRIYGETGAEAVDMESFSIFKVARDERVPFLAIHSVTDTADEDIPALEIIAPFLESKSPMRYARLFWKLVGKPRLVLDLATLHHDARVAGRCLAHFLKANESELCGLVRESIRTFPADPGV